MTREEKLAVINGLAEQLEQYPHFYITNIEALNAEQTAKLRRKCFENNIKLVVVKNTLFGKALEKVEKAEVTAICPAGIATDLYGLSPKLQRFGVKTGILMTPKSCARRALNGMFRGVRCKVPDWWFRLFIPVCQLVRGPLMRWLRNFTMQFQK